MASQIILAVNAGSSSLKITLFEARGEQLTSLANAEVSAINQPPSKEKYTCGQKKSKKDLPDVKSHEDAFNHVLDALLQEKDLHAFKHKSDITYVCHRVVHGGDFSEDQLITEETLHKLEALEDLAPLHNASAVALIKTCLTQLPQTKNIAAFDSVFHHSMPDYVTTYAIDQKIAKEKGLRKYGFHGISYSYITRAVSKYLNKDESHLNLIALHLGSGASACAIQKGKSVDTTMGLTPVSGLPGGSRSGDIDPSLIFHYTSDASKLSPGSTKDLHISTAEDILNKQSGWKSLTGTSDFAQIADADAPESHQLAFNIVLDRIVGYVGSYFVKLEGKVDALVFAGGIGENSPLLRQRVVEKCACLGFTIDEASNQKPGDGAVVDISQQGRMATLICETDEEFEMAYHCVRNLK